MIELAGYRAIVEIARAPRVAAAPAAPAQQNLQLEAAAAPSAVQPGAVTASPSTILADLARNAASLQQVETQGAATVASEGNEPSRPRRRRRPSANKPEAEASGLMQVETSAPANLVETPVSSAPHPTRRRPRPPANVSQEPLVQVETQAK